MRVAWFSYFIINFLHACTQWILWIRTKHYKHLKTYNYILAVEELNASRFEWRCNHLRSLIVEEHRRRESEYGTLSPCNLISFLPRWPWSDISIFTAPFLDWSELHEESLRPTKNVGLKEKIHCASKALLKLFFFQLHCSNRKGFTPYG